MVNKNNIGSRIFDLCNIVMMFTFCLSILYPFWNVLMVSLNDPSAGNLTGLSLLPKKFTLENYKNVLSYPEIWNGYRETIIRTVFGTCATMLFTTTSAYALAQHDLPNRKFWTVIVLIPMFFSGGLIPSYLNVKSLGLIDSRMSLILPGLVSIYNLIIMRNYIMTLPKELRESAWIDG
ncbi:MAG TPA: ABC transporter permease, partial [Clostridiales bacterium]|nr:ABC transporter permease [Clostridiales bacterium]